MNHLSFFSPLALAATFLLAACNPEEVNMDNPPNLRVLSGDEQALIQSSNDFTFNLFKAIHAVKSEENMFISPLSVDIALAMTVNGASGATKEVMKQTLGLENLSDEEANEAVKALNSLLLSMDRKVALSIANSIWYRNTYTLKDGFASLIQEYYDGKIEGLDFSDPSTKDIVNQWVEEKTQGKIKDLLETVEPSDVMYLVNAIYFKAAWQYEFDKKQTQESPFTLEDGTQIQVPMMFSKGAKVSRYIHEHFQLVEIPYGNGQFTMVILLPHTGKTVQEVIDILTGEQLSIWIAQADTLTPQLYLPKFKTEFKMDLKIPLSDMGMELPFTPLAEFHGFFNEDVGDDLYIDRVIHQSFIEVNEEGSEAAAATLVAIGELTSIPGNDFRSIRIDRPFIYLIRERHSGAVLFAGKMLRPGK